MHLLRALGDLQGPTTGAAEISEFRLLCSGALYNGRILGGDWTKSDACRVLCREPVALMSVSTPPDDYPQELLLKVAVRPTEVVKEAPGGGKSISTFTPHAEVASDLAALLTLLLRRLVTVHCQVSVKIPLDPKSVLGLLVDEWPMPIFRPASVTAWRPRPLFVSYTLNAPPRVTGYSVPPLGIDVDWLRAILIKLPSVPTAPALLACARLYAEAMQILEDRPEVAYQLFIAAAETLASVAAKNFQPTDAEKADTKRVVSNRALALGLAEPAARELAILATADMKWTGQKFRQCLMRYADDSIWLPDDLFVLEADWLPKREEFETVLRKICRMRGAVLHSGERFPASVGIGTTPLVPVRALQDLLAGDTFPPVTWFERVVQRAALCYAEETLGVAPARPAV